MSKKSFFMGTFILAAAGIISRFAGFFYRIFLSNTLGAKGIGIFQLALPVQTLLLSISAMGIQTAISQLSASSFALKDRKKSTDYFCIGTFFSILFSVFLSTILYRNAPFIAAELLKEEQTCDLIKILAFNIPLSTIHICINGFYFSQKKTLLPSCIQLAEQLTKILASCFLYFYMVRQNLPVTAVFAAAGSFISEIIAVFTGFIALKIDFQKTLTKLFPISQFLPKTKELFHLAIPLTLNRVLLTLLGSIEVVLIPQQLQASGMNSSQALSIYGILSGMALPLILFPSTLTNSAAVMLMPSVTELHTLKQHKKLRHIIFLSYNYVFTLGLCFTAFFYLFGNLAGNLLFHNPTAGIYIRTLGFLCPFLYLNTTLSSILHGLKKMGISLLHNTISICIRIFFVVYIIPLYGIQGYLYGVIFSECIKTLLYSLSLYLFNAKN